MLSSKNFKKFFVYQVVVMVDVKDLFVKQTASFFVL